MKKSLLKKPALLALAVFVPACALAQQPDTTMELRLREALRATTLQLRSAQSESAALQVTNTELEKERDALKKQTAALAGQGEKDRAAAAKEIAGLKAAIVSQEEKAAQLSEDLARWKTSSQQAATLADSKEQARAALALRLTGFERALADCETRNIALIKIGNEILDRLEKFGLGDAIRAREPFIGTKRVEIQNLVQNYADKIMDQKYQPPPPPPPQSTTTASSAPR
ncbi:phage major capsid protein [Opitutaceae bacterium TAV3]|nr:phage major capsid protein [Opitutaceae bacterium TAV3]